MPSLISPETIAAYERDGFVNVGGMLAREEVETLRSELERHIDRNFRGVESSVPGAIIKSNMSDSPSDEVHHIGGLWVTSEVYRLLVHHPRITQAAAELARSETLQLWADQLFYKPPRRGGPLGWHQDAPYHQAVSPDVSLTAWVALDDAEIETGCLWMVPGSHKWGVLEPHLWHYRGQQWEVADFRSMQPPPTVSPEVYGEWTGPVACPVRAGEVHFHHALTWHASPANRSERVRRAYAIHYMPDGVFFNGEPNPYVSAAGIEVPGTPMAQADPAIFPMVFRRGKRA